MASEEPRQPSGSHRIPGDSEDKEKKRDVREEENDDIVDDESVTSTTSSSSAQPTDRSTTNVGHLLETDALPEIKTVGVQRDEQGGYDPSWGNDAYIRFEMEPEPPKLESIIEVRITKYKDIMYINMCR